MDFAALVLHLTAFGLPAVFVAACTTVAARWGRPAAWRGWTGGWLQWLACSAAGLATLCGSLWWSGHDGRMLGYAALALVCSTVSWALSPAA